jgi:hypothetical protein
MADAKESQSTRIHTEVFVLPATNASAEQLLKQVLAASFEADERDGNALESPGQVQLKMLS